MGLVERTTYLNVLTDHYRNLTKNGGHTVFLMGEAGIGKTSLVSHFIKEINTAHVYTGACDSLFTPRPLGPLYDIAGQTGGDFLSVLKTEKDRSIIFAAFLQQLATSVAPLVLVIEDIHWADEASVDFIKFLARRITRFQCLFILTFRDEEIPVRHPLRSLFGELPTGTFSKLHINSFSPEAVDKLARAVGYDSGEKIHSLTGGNPFYVTEILASPGHDIPERVKDSILTVFHSKNDDIQSWWELLSVLPSRVEIHLLDRITFDSPIGSLEECLQSGVIVRRNDFISFKHELFRIAIEQSLSIYKRKGLHKKILERMMECPPGMVTLSQLVHHAKFADDRQLVAKLAPQAAQEAALMGAHVESSRLYQIAIEYTDKNDPQIAELYEHHGYECYLTSQIDVGITSQQRALEIWRERKISLRIGDTLRFLSRLRWFICDRKEAMALAHEAIAVLENGFPTRERALAYSNLSQLSMLADDTEKSLYWGQRAMDLAIKMEDNEILCHALNNMGSTLLRSPGSEPEGEQKLRQSLAIALENGFHEHAARAYTNLSCFLVLIKQYAKAIPIFDAGIKYCEERDLLSWSSYIKNEKTRLLLETGRWAEAEAMSISLQSSPDHLNLSRIQSTSTLARLKVRQGKFTEARALINEAKRMAQPTGEAYRMIPVLTAELELCWTNHEHVPAKELAVAEIVLIPEKSNSWHYAALAYWMSKCKMHVPSNDEVTYPGPFRFENANDWLTASEAWSIIGSPFEQALALLEADEENQKRGLQMLYELGAPATADMMKTKLRDHGVRHIPRGPRESTRNNPALLTERQVEILLLLQKGSPTKEIAEVLFISPKTVDHHISAILSKLEVNSRNKAVLAARDLGILK